MAKEIKPPKTEPTPFEKFTEASRELFNLPKETVQKTIAKYPSKTIRPRKKNR